MPFRASNTTNGFGTSTVLTKPTGTVDGDLLIVLLAYDANGSVPTITPPSGWTEHLRNENSDVHGSIVVYYKEAASEGASWTWSYSSTIFVAASVLAYSDVKPTLNTSTSGSLDSAVNAQSINGVTTTVDDCVVVNLIALRTSSGSAGLAPPGSATERTDARQGVVTGETSDFTQGTAGATGGKTYTPASGTYSWKYAVLALAPRTVHAGAAVLNAAATVASAATETYAGKATPSGAATLAPRATLTMAGAAALAGSGALTPLAKLTYAGRAALAGSATLALDGNIGVLLGVTALAASASLSASGSYSLLGAASLAAVATLAGVGVSELPVFASLTPSAAMAAVAQLSRPGAAIWIAPGVGRFTVPSKSSSGRFFSTKTGVVR